MSLSLLHERRAPGEKIPVGRSAGWLMLLLLLAPVCGFAEDTVIYPRSAVPSETPAKVASVGSNTTMLLLALTAAAVGGWLLWRQRCSTQGLLSREARKLAVTETRSLGNRQYLVVADYEGRKFLLGVCPGRIDMLANLDGTNLPPRLP